MENFTLNDIAGYKTEKEELLSIIAMFKNFNEYKKKGAYLSKELVLSGAPGVGKTLFAKVLANEINAPFFYIDGSAINGIQGVRKIKKIFQKAQEVSPSIIFIDELNSFVGDYDYESDETNRNLSTLLKLIDGIQSNSGVFVIGASTDKDDLDDALVRSGRMDKHICLDKPDFQSRMEIFNFYLQKVDLNCDNVDKNFLVEQMYGLNGADIKTVVNETALQCFYKNIEATTDDFLYTIQRIEERDIIHKNTTDGSLAAYHDIGHLVVAKILGEKYNDVSIEFASNYLGNTSIEMLLYDEDEDEKTGHESFETKNTVLNKVCVLLGAMALEEVVLKAQYLSCENDVTAAIRLIRTALECGLFGFEYVNKQLCEFHEMSAKTLEKLEAKYDQILTEQFERAKKIIGENIPVVNALHEELMLQRKLSRHEIEKIFAEN